MLALPGPLTLAAAAGRDRALDTLESLGAEILDALKLLGPEHADCLAVVELVPVTADDPQPLEDALAPVWNTARYYAAASLLVAAEGPAELGDTGADAVAVWTGASPHELAARGVRHVGAPMSPPAKRERRPSCRRFQRAVSSRPAVSWPPPPTSIGFTRRRRGGGEPLTATQILEMAATEAERSLELYRELLRVPSVWGDARELRVVRLSLLGAELSGAGLEVRLPDSGTPGMPMLLARLRGGGGPTLLFAGHIEVYPPSNRGRSILGRLRSVTAASTVRVPPI